MKCLNGNSRAFRFWPMTLDQTVETIAKLLVEKVVCVHGVPEQLLGNFYPSKYAQHRKAKYVWLPSPDGLLNSKGE